MDSLNLRKNKMLRKLSRIFKIKFLMDIKLLSLCQERKFKIFKKSKKLRKRYKLKSLSKRTQNYQSKTWHSKLVKKTLKNYLRNSAQLKQSDYQRKWMEATEVSHSCNTIALKMHVWPNRLLQTPIYMEES